MKRVVVTGMSAATPLGDSWLEVKEKLKSGSSGIRRMNEWSDIKGLGSLLAAPARPDIGQDIPRKKSRAMSRVSKIAAETAGSALAMSQLSMEEVGDENIGIAYGSSFGSSEQLVPFGRVFSENTVRGISPSGYIKLMGHTTAVNLSLYLGVKGRLIPCSSACASGGQALGYAYETIKQGIHPVMIAGSSEELSPMQVAVFDSFYAASKQHLSPSTAVKPFDQNRNGTAIGEGGATFVLEDLDHALSRKAPIIAEITGFATNMDGSHIIQQDRKMMTQVIQSALKSANLKANDIGYINAHASGTESDITEAAVIRDLFGSGTPVASNKGHIGHCLGGCGSIESWLSICMMNEEWFAPSLNLETIDPGCSGIGHIKPDGLEQLCNYVMNNNFAFGGVNISIIFKRWSNSA